MSLSRDSYKLAATTSIRCKLSPSYATRLIKYRKILAFTTGEYVSSKSMLGLVKIFEQQVVLCISQFYHSHLVFAQKPIYIQLVLHLQVYRLQVQKLFA